jgi:3-oxoacyl-[acyl-carrier-protein] synthase II
MGALTPIGNDVQTFWRSLLAGKAGAGKITHFDTLDMPYNIACEVKGFDPTEYIDRKTARRIHRSAQFAVAVSRQALDDARLTIDESNWDRVGVLMATGGGGITEIEVGAFEVLNKGWRSVGPFVVPSAMANAVSCVVSIETGARGPVMTSTAACASGHYSIIEGYHFLKRGEADVIIAGGAESLMSMLTMAAFGRMGPLSSRFDDPEHACRPFSIDRDGFVAGEGAAAVILETEEHARARGAKLYAEVLGGKLTADAFHITAPDPEGMGAARALSGALQMAGVDPHEVKAVFAHGTGTALNDIGEAKALKRAFGDAAYDMRITSIKSMVGHALGAAGAQSAVAAVCALNEGCMPPTINYTPDPEIDLHIVGNTAEEVESRYAIVNAFGFGGQNVVAVFGKVEE